MSTRVRAQLQAEVHRALARGGAPKPAPPPDVALVNELVREYLRRMGYDGALSVFELETGCEAAAPLPRAFLGDEVGVAPSAATSPLPLLYTVVRRAHADRKAVRLRDDGPPPGPAADCGTDASGYSAAFASDDEASSGGQVPGATGAATLRGAPTALAPQGTGVFTSTVPLGLADRRAPVGLAIVGTAGAHHRC